MATAMRAMVVALLFNATALAGVAAAGQVYRWTDAKGVVHFSDVPPPATRFETETLPDAPQPIAQPPTPASDGADAASHGADGAAQPAAAQTPNGTARLVLSDQQSEEISSAVQSFRGKVKNQGTADAHDVFVELVVTEPAQGEECLNQEIDVEPATLAPGAEGTYEAEFEHPCFHGETNAELRAAWR